MNLRDLSRLVQCSASPALIGAADTIKAEHALAWQVAADILALGAPTPDADGEMVEAALVLTEHVATFAAGGSEIVVGAKLEAATGQTVSPLAYSVHRPSQTVRLWGYDYGHRLHDPHGSYDLAVHVDAIRIAHDLPSGWWAQVHMVQPRCYVRSPHVPSLGLGERHVTTWRVDFAATLPDMMGRLASALEAVASGRTATYTGEFCVGCPAAFRCEALLRASEIAVEAAGSRLPVDLDARAVSHALRTLRGSADRLKARLTALEAQARHMILRGDGVPGWTLEQGRGRRAWTLPDVVVIEIARGLGYDLAKPPEPITPTQALKAGLDEAIVQSMSAHEAGKATLAEVTETAIRRKMGTP